MFSRDGVYTRGILYSNIKPEVNPVVHAARKVPVAQREKFQEELNQMEKLNIITKVEWAHGMGEFDGRGAETQWNSKNMPVSKRPKHGD